MRLHAQKGNNRTRAKARRVTVTLNGVDVTPHTFNCDTRQGWVEGYARLMPPLSGYCMDKGGKSLKTERRHGVVRLHCS